MQVWWRRATRGARNHVAGRAFAKAIQAKPADAEGVLHVPSLIGEDVYGVVDRDVCKIESTETGTLDDHERAKPALNE